PFALRQKKNAELIAAEARQHVLRLQLLADAAHQRQKQSVARGEADLVVDRFELVDVDDKNDRADALVRRRKGQSRLDTVEEELAVRKTGQAVIDGIAQKALFRRLAVGDVDQRADAARHLAMRRDDRADAQQHVMIMPVLGAEAELLGNPAAALADD